MRVQRKCNKLNQHNCILLPVVVESSPFEIKTPAVRSRLPPRDSLRFPCPKSGMSGVSGAGASLPLIGVRGKEMEFGVWKPRADLIHVKKSLSDLKGLIIGAKLSSERREARTCSLSSLLISVRSGVHKDHLLHPSIYVSLVVPRSSLSFSFIDYC
ncbi:hypothetical protein CEK26_000208 [Fusarium fujikuroi]|uniref:Uncharacterized protein n=1 Tax=Fusarium fujikuroi TaxID=5127 RepID=A0A0I9XU20_FUSFU|nr:Uncharacterized protein LW93_11367 [Fusarium fujikuroi]KLO91638.1 Uncharacterized protein Y057_13025 [Fusarium fujikuroi]QGI58080.1 hypothetical protein CEK27_000205 [Fusarium fujikuroi]QGI75298.1 hypothetical protein CEK25_000204 [Fusarium fujikuroi]QGI88993.1 hypothetical protein CEK26_000208 [Fusarium fujikuroi]